MVLRTGRPDHAECRAGLCLLYTARAHHVTFRQALGASDDSSEMEALESSNPLQCTWRSQVSYGDRQPGNSRSHRKVAARASDCAVIKSGPCSEVKETVMEVENAPAFRRELPLPCLLSVCKHLQETDRKALRLVSRPSFQRSFVA